MTGGKPLLYRDAKHGRTNQETVKERNEELFRRWVSASMSSRETNYKVNCD